MLFFNVNFEVPGGIRQYQQNLSRALEYFGHKVVQCNIESWRTEFLKRETDCKSVTLLHDPIQAEAISPNRSRSLRIWLFIHGDYDFYWNAAIRHHIWVERIFCVNENSRLILRKKHRIRNITYLPPILPSLEKFTSVRSTEFQIIFVGRLESNKGAHLLPQISKFLVEYGLTHTLKIIYSSSYMESDVESLVLHWASDADHVELFEDLNHNQSLQQIAASHALILPSRKEGFPLCVAEAMGLGTIPIVSRYSPGVESQLPSEYHRFITDFKLNYALFNLIREACSASAQFREIGQSFIANNNSFNKANHVIQPFIEGKKYATSKIVIRNAITLALWKNRILRLLNRLFSQ